MLIELSGGGAGVRFSSSTWAAPRLASLGGRGNLFHRQEHGCGRRLGRRMALDHLKREEPELFVECHRAGLGVHNHPDAAKLLGHPQSKTQYEAEQSFAETLPTNRLI